MRQTVHDRKLVVLSNSSIQLVLCQWNVTRNSNVPLCEIQIGMEHSCWIVSWAWLIRPTYAGSLCLKRIGRKYMKQEEKDRDKQVTPTFWFKLDAHLLPNSNYKLLVLLIDTFNVWGPNIWVTIFYTWYFGHHLKPWSLYLSRETFSEERSFQ